MTSKFVDMADFGEICTMLALRFTHDTRSVANDHKEVEANHGLPVGRSFIANRRLNLDGST